MQDKRREVLSLGNAMFVLKDVSFTSTGTIELKCTRYRFNSYKRRDVEPYECTISKCYVYESVMLPGLDVSNMIEFYRLNWKDFVKDAWQNCEQELCYANAKQNCQLGKIYAEVGAESKKYANLKEAFISLVMMLDVKPSEVSFDVKSGYANDMSREHYDYQTYQLAISE